MTFDHRRFIPADRICGEDDRETRELRAMLEGARSYLLSHPWCESVADARLGFGVGGVVAVFLFRASIRPDHEEFLWVVEGDLPSAYLVTDDAPTAADALERYAELMDDWVVAVRSGSGIESAFPVAAPADEKHADLLERRILLLRSDIVPAARTSDRIRR